MKIWIARHGQTRLNKDHRMQGRIDEPLNETGLRQAREVRKLIADVKFDAVYSSPLDRAMTTGSIISGLDKKDLITDDRIIEVSFGKYEGKKFTTMGLNMVAYWVLPEIFPRPKTVESIDSMVARSSSFLRELEHKDYDNVLVACHGGIMRALTGYMCDRKNGTVWRPKPKNCEIRIFESLNGRHRFLKQIIPEVSDI